MDGCKICTGDFEKSPDKVVLCRHHKGMVHMGCCCNRCSMDGKPCQHTASIYKKE